MNLHELKSTTHELFGDYDRDPQYWCSCGWAAFGISEHAESVGLVKDRRNATLFYCKGHERAICNRILTVAGTDCGDHML